MKSCPVIMIKTASGGVQRARCRHCRFCNRDPLRRTFTGRCSTTYNARGEWVDFKNININAFACDKFQPYFKFEIYEFAPPCEQLLLFN